MPSIHLFHAKLPCDSAPGNNTPPAEWRFHYATAANECRDIAVVERLRRIVTTCAVTAALSAGIAGVAGQVPRPATGAGFRLERLNTYGWEEMRGDSSLTPADRRAMGGVLAHIADIDLSPAGDELLVLDAEFKKVVVFGIDGTYRRVILGGYGKGPGEFVRPRSLCFVNAHDFVVLDQGTARVSFFSINGPFIRSFNVLFPQPLQVQARDDLLFIKRAPRIGHPAIMHLHLDGAVVDSSFAIDDRNAQFTEYGELGYLGVDATGSMVYAHPAVGRWSILNGAQWRGPFGVELFPKERGRIQRVRGVDVRMAYVGVRGFAQLGSGETLILARSLGALQEDPQKEVAQAAYLAVFSKAGKYLGHISLPDGETGPLVPGSSRDDFYIAANEPFPRVVHYRIRRQ